jgi:hypothetical protein
MDSFDFVAIAIFFSFPALFLVCIAGHWLLKDVKRSPLKRGILVTLLIWATGGVYLQAVHQKQSEEYYAGYYALNKAINLKDIERVKGLLARGVDPNRYPPDDARDEDENLSLPLYTAVGNKDVAVAKLLLEHGANPNARDEDCDSLVQAAFDGNIEMMRLLFHFGAGANRDDALWRAATTGQGKAVRFLLDHGANPSMPFPEYDHFALGRNGRTLAQVVVGLGYPGIATMLENATQKGKN